MLYHFAVQTFKYKSVCVCVHASILTYIEGYIDIGIMYYNAHRVSPRFASYTKQVRLVLSQQQLSHTQIEKFEVFSEN